MSLRRSTSLKTPALAGEHFSSICETFLSFSVKKLYTINYYTGRVLLWKYPSDRALSESYRDR